MMNFYISEIKRICLDNKSRVVFARTIAGWKVSNRMNTDMVMAILNQALAERNKAKDVIHHTDRGVKYLSIRYTDRMAEAGVIASVGTTCDSYDNALVETVTGYIILRSFII